MTGAASKQVASKRDLIQEVLDTLQIAAMIFWESWLRALGKAKRSPLGTGSLGESKPLQACLGSGLETKDPWLLSMTSKYTNKPFYHAVSFVNLYLQAACISARAVLTASPPSAKIEGVKEMAAES